MKHIFLLVFLFSSISVFAQDGQEWKESSKESQAYHEYRVKPTVPPYGLAKIKGLIKQIKMDEEEMEALNQKVYDALSLREKFTYHMIHAESYSQNCDAMPPIQNEQKKIFAYIPDAFDEYDWSDRQVKFLSSNRDSVIALMKESISRTKRVGVNFKQAIIEINAKEMIPFLIATYNITKKDHDILTLFLQLMKDNEYEAFLNSGSYKKLYSEDSNYQAFLNFNTANESLIIKRATDFYNAGKN
jgi:hypothetical protein